MTKKHMFDSLTGLKGLFSLIIVFFHTLPSTPLIEQIPFTSIIQNYGGMIGNYFFFITSGFLISAGYRQRIGNREVTFQAFLVKRLCKLYPLYLITNLVSLIINTCQFGFSAINIKRIVFTVLLQNGGGLETAHPYNGPSWFISALLVCYILYFFAAYHAKNSTQYYCITALGIVWGYSILSGRCVAPLAFAHHGDSIFCFFIGCAMTELYPHIKTQFHRWLQPVSIVCLLGSGFLMMKYGLEVIAGDFKVAFACFLCPLIIYLALFNRATVLFLTSKPIQYLGRLSFSIFLWHFVVYDFFRYTYAFFVHTSEIKEPQYLMYLVLTGIVSVLSNQFLENKTWIRSADRV